MKKLVLTFLVALGMVSGADAQLIVLENGQTQLGNSLANADADPAATLNLWEISRKYGGSISFGDGSGAMISGDGATGRLSFKAKTSFGMSVGNNIVALSFTTQSRVFRFGYEIQAPSFLTTSDARFKKNISSLEGLGSGIMNLNPVSYNLSYPAATDSLATKLSKNTESMTDNRVHYGFVAQEVKEIFPELVVEDEEGMLSIDYSGFIPLLVEAYQDLAGKVKEQEEIIEKLTGSPSPSFMPASVSDISDSKPALKQNTPNPFNYSTTIECFVPQSVGSAFICMYDLQGKQMLRMDIKDRGAVNKQIEASSLTPGMYVYTLIADGAEIDSKRMIITD